MGVTIGPADWWITTLESINSLAIGCPVGTTLPDGSRIICKAGGTAWIVAPSSTEVGQTWNSTTTTQVGNKPCVCDWPTLNTRLINCGFNPCDWFVPSISQLNNPGYVCRTRWDCFASTFYWSSTEINATNACYQSFINGCICTRSKAATDCVRAFRCVTY
jgi:hypothetical protein